MISLSYVLMSVRWQDTAKAFVTKSQSCMTKKQGLGKYKFLSITCLKFNNVSLYAHVWLKLKKKM